MRFFLTFFLFIIFDFDLNALNQEQEPTQEKTEKNKEEKEQKKEEKSEEKKEEKKETQSQDNTSQKGSEEAEKTVKIGNLAFPVSQQPTPLISFGQNMLEKKQAQALVMANQFKGEKQYFVNVVPSLLYAFTDDFSVFLSVPIAVRYRQKNQHASGPADAIIQLEYAFYTKAYRTYYDQATVIASVILPTGSAKKNPNTGLGSNSFFIGGTYSRMEIDWFYFVSTGGIITTSSHRTRFGDQFLYQFGIGRRIFNTKEWLFDWMIELNGVYSWKNKIQGTVDPNSGGNVIFVTPSLWISSMESLIFQLGFGFPIHQHLFGHQMKEDYLVEMNVGWTF